MKKIISFFAKEHTIGNLLTFFLIAAGIYSISNIRRDIFPPVNYDITLIRALLPGASPEQGEKLILNSIEEKIKEVDGIDEVRSATTESQSLVTIKLDPNARDINKTNSDIQNAIDQIDSLPDDAEKPVITNLESGLLPVIEAIISGPFDDFQIRKISNDLADELGLVDGVSSVSKLGYFNKEYLVSLDQQKMKRRQISMSQVIRSLQTQNISAPAGKLTLSSGNDELIRTEGQYQSEQDILNTQVSANLDGFGTKLKDIATVTKQLEEPTRVYKYEGNKSIILQITKKVNADALRLVKEIKQTTADFIEQYDSRINVSFSKDMSVYLKTRLQALGGNLLIGLLLVIIVLTLFLPWQVTLVVSIGVPVALLGTFAVAFLLNWSINLISLIGLIIVLGMLVDDAIVVSENIWSEFEKTGDKAKSIVDGVMNVIGPVTASILTTVSAFAPMLFMSGIFGAFVFHIPSMVILALAFSMFEVFLILPSHFSNWVGGSAQKRQKKKHWFDPCIRIYKRFVGWSLRFRYLMLLSGIIVFSSTVFLVYKSGKFKLFSSDGVNLFFVKIEGPPSISLDEMSKKIEPIEKLIAELPKTEILDYVSTIGIYQRDPLDPQTKYGNQFASIQINLQAKLPNGRTAFDIMADLNKKLTVPEGLISVQTELPPQGPPQGRDVSIDISGSDFDVLYEIADKIVTELRNDGLVKNIDNSFIPGKDEWQITPKPLAMAASGITTAQLAQDIRAEFDGVIATSIRTLDEEINIRVQTSKSDDLASDTLTKLKSIKVGNKRGSLTQLSKIATFEKSKSLSMITHLNYKRSLNVSADSIDPSDNRKALQSIKPKVKEIFKNYPGYKYNYGGMDKDTNESLKSLFVAFMAAFFFIFSLLIVTFRSFLQPILILTSIPLGFIGAILAMLLHGKPFGFMSLLGTVALAGVIVNNSIVLTDFVNKSRKRGLDLSKSIVDAAGKRLRPIVLTTITTVSGLMPTAYGNYLEEYLGIGGYDPFIVPIALALGWGLFMGSILTLIYFPCFIRILDDIRFLFVKKQVDNE